MSEGPIWSTLTIVSLWPGRDLAKSLANVWSTFEPAAQGPRLSRAPATAASAGLALISNVRSESARAAGLADEPAVAFPASIAALMKLTFA